MKRKFFAASGIVGAFLMTVVVAHAATTAVNCTKNGPGALITAVGAASPGAVLSVTGACNGGFFIGNNMDYGTIQPATAGTKVTVNGPIGVSGAQYLTLSGLALKGGGSMNGVPAGLFLAPLSYVIFTDGSITGFGGSGGVELAGVSYLEMTGSTVANNKGAAGILVVQGATAQLGFFDANGNLCCGNVISGNIGPGVDASSSANVSSWLTTYKDNTGPQIAAYTNSGIDSRGDSIAAGATTGLFVASGSKASMYPSGTLASGTLTGGTVTSSGVAVEAAAQGAVFLRDVTINATSKAPAVLGATQGQIQLQGANKITASGGGLALEMVFSAQLYQDDGVGEGWAAAADTVSGASAAEAGSGLNLTAATVTGGVTLVSSGLGLGDSKGVETVTIKGNVTLSQASGGGAPSTAVKSKTKIDGTLSCTDVNKSSHYAAALVTVSGVNTCPAY